MNEYLYSPGKTGSYYEGLYSLCLLMSRDNVVTNIFYRLYIYWFTLNCLEHYNSVRVMRIIRQMVRWSLISIRSCILGLVLFPIHVNACAFDNKRLLTYLLDCMVGPMKQKLLKGGLLHCIRQLIDKGTLHHGLRSHNLILILGRKCAYCLFPLLLRRLTAVLVFFVRG